MYYLVAPQHTANPDRKRALYVPADDQVDDPEIIKLIDSRGKL